nr:MAG TPA: hypothetical protein [Caudoviricetes sp.]
MISISTKSDSVGSEEIWANSVTSLPTLLSSLCNAIVSPVVL